MSWKVTGPSTNMAVQDAAKKPWDRWSARDRVIQWAKTDGDGDEFDEARASRAFLFHDSDRKDDLWGGYAVQIGDIVDGELVMISDALIEARAALTKQSSWNPPGSGSPNFYVEWVPNDIPADVLAEGKAKIDTLIAKHIENADPADRADAAVPRHGGLAIRVDRSVRFAIEKRDGTLMASYTPQGFLRVEPSLLARDGCLEYSDGKSTWNEYRSAQSLIDAAASFSLVPLTNDHPPEMVTADNCKQYDAGTIGEVDILRGEDGVTYIRAPIVVRDPDLIASALAGETCELSIGFLCNVLPQSGVLADGTEYSYVQDDLVGNHVAAVVAGRAGPNCRFATLDRKDNVAWTIDHATVRRTDMKTKTDLDPMQPAAPAAPAMPAAAPAAPAPAPAPAPAAAAPAPAPAPAGPEMVEVPGLGAVPAPLAALFQKLMAMIAGGEVPAEAGATEAGAQAGDGAGEEMEDGEDAGKDDKKMDSLKTENEALKGKLDAQDAAFKRYQAEEAERIDARVRLTTDAKEILGRDADLHGKSETAIMRLVIEKIDGDKVPDDKSADYVRGRYEASLKSYSAKVDNKIEDDATFEAGEGGEVVTLDSIAAESAARQAGKWAEKNKKGA